MALPAGRVGVARSEVDANGKIRTGGAEGKDVYLLEETVIGTFLGKPRYRKVFRVEHFSSAETSSATWNFPHNIEDLDIDGIKIDVTRYVTTIGLATTFPVISQDSLSRSVTVGVNATDIYIYLASNQWTSKGYIILEYCKTTD